MMQGVASHTQGGDALEATTERGSPKACIEPKVEGRPVRFVECFRPDNLDDCPEVARGLDGREAGLLSKMGAP